MKMKVLNFVWSYIVNQPFDCGLVVQDSSMKTYRFEAHRTILRSVSPVFDNIFKHQQEARVEHCDILLSGTWDPRDLKDLLDLLYTDNIQIDPSRFKSLERTASLLEIDLDALSVDLSYKQNIKNQEEIGVDVSDKSLMSNTSEKKNQRSEIPGNQLAELKPIIRVMPMRTSKATGLAKLNCLDKIPVSAACQNCHRLFVIGQLNKHENLYMQKKKQRQQYKI